MARRRRSVTTSPEARDIALAIRRGERSGLTQREIAGTLGINERTVRKIKSGQTSGRKTYQRIVKAPERSISRNAFNAEFAIGTTASGEVVIGSTNVRLPDLPTARGGTRRPTALDVFDPRLQRRIQAVIAAERAKLLRRYESVATVADPSARIRLKRVGIVRRTIHDITTLSA